MEKALPTGGFPGTGFGTTMDRSTRKTVNLGNQDGTPPPGQARTRGKRVFAVVLAALFTGACMFGAGARFFHHMYETLPSPDELSNIQPSLVSKVLASDGSVIHEFSVERRFWVPLARIPEQLRQAVISIEDRRFYRHWGIDMKRVLGAIFVDLVRGHYAQGASTITQQLARNVYLTSRQTLIRKIREALTAVQLESYYTKDEILELYLNMVYLGAGVYGVQAASRHYFSKPVSDLSLNECAVLAGCIQLPEYYRPDREKNAERTISRRNVVLRSMRKMRFVEDWQVNEVSADTVPSNPQERVAKQAPYFIEVVRGQLEEKLGEHQLYNGGLTIYTTLDPVAQDSADSAAAHHLDTLQRKANRLFLDSTKAYRALGITRSQFLAGFDSIHAAHEEEYRQLPDSLRLRAVQVAVVALDVRTGAVRVLTGGRNFAESKFNRAVQARRQPGSSFKPFVYTAAIDSGYTPASVVIDRPITLETPEGTWRPENYGREFYGPVTLRYALKKSINLVAIQVLMDVGPRRVIEFARRMGLKHSLNPVPALAIGACEATVMEMTSAYSIFPNGGSRAEPYFIEKVVDKNGRVIESVEHREKAALRPVVAYLMCDLLTSVIRSGTGASIPAGGFNRPAGGKTGTTDDYSDAWFVGFTPQIACGVWVGVDERRSMGHGVTGSCGAIPIWLGAMKTLHRDLPVRTFARPPDIVQRRVCGKTNKLATAYCPDWYTEVFSSTALPDTCDFHGLRTSKRSDNVIRLFGSGKRREPDKSKKKRRLVF